MNNTALKKTPTTFQAWIMTIRPRTLSIPTIQVLTSLALVYSMQGRIDWVLAIFTLLVAICVTIEVNVFNDVIDFRKGGDSLDRHGHVKVIPAGFLTEKQVFTGALFFGALVLLFGIPLIIKAGWLMGIFLVLSALFAYCYTGGPYPICYLGLSELFILLFYGFVCIGSSVYVQTGHIDFSALLLSLQMGLFAILPAVINNFRDQEEDAKTNKRNLIVRLGKSFGRWEITLLTVLPVLLGVFWVVYGHPMATAMPLLNFPLSFLLIGLVWKTEPGPIYNRYFALSTLVHFIFGLLLGVGLNM